VIEIVPTLLPPANPQYPPPDIVLHIGLAAGRDYFAIEQGSSKTGYGEIPDVDGKLFADTLSSAKFDEDKFPATLTTSFDTSDVLARWKSHLGFASPDGDATLEERPDVRASANVGNFMCGFIYYNSLAHYFSIKQDERPVVFLHVPDLSGNEDKLREGKKVTVALIKALVESLQKVGLVDVGRQADDDLGTANGQQTDNNFA
jgi:pyroglutamyl-peptidase